MSVRIHCVSQPVDPEIPGPAELIAYFARVSSTANQHKHETGGKLLRSLVRRAEWSPFEMVSLTMEIVTTRDIARQILRHRSFSFQEFSQRYAVVTEEPVFREARTPHPTDRQLSIETADFELRDRWAQLQLYASAYAVVAYKEALEAGIAKEVARAVLPEGMTTSRLYMAGNLRSWLHYVQLRADPKTQKEHRVIAEQCRAVLIDTFPALADLLSGDTP